MPPSTTSARVARLLPAMVSLALLATACGADAPTRNRADGPTVSTPRSTCHEDGDREVVVPGPEGATTFAVTVGAGRRAVILVHEADTDHCAWMLFARALGRRGVQVWSLDSSASPASLSVGSSNPSRDVVSVAAYVRQHGASEVVVAGASMGGTGALAAAHDAGAVKAAALSSPSDYNGADAVAGVKAFGAPVLVLVGTNDSGFVPSAAAFEATDPTHVTKLDVVTDAHGTDLLGHDVGGKHVFDVLADFLTS
ncbi:MAG: hypothetical protein U0Q15_19140 [Kineosporiaceae bacterium]